MNRLEELNKIIKDVYSNPEYQPKNGETYCNLAIAEIVKRMGFNAFQDLMANQIVHKMNEDKTHWLELFINGARLLTEDGKSIPKDVVVIIAGNKGPIHGHVCIVYPDLPWILSTKWNKFVPQCMNVGKANFLNKGINYAFKKEPQIFGLIV